MAKKPIEKVRAIFPGNTKKRRNVVWISILVLFVAAICSKDLYKVVLEVPSPDSQFTATIKRSLGWGILFYGSIYYLEIRDRATGENLDVIQQPESEGWHSFAPDGIEWAKNSRRIRCKWLIIQHHHEDLLQTFEIRRNPLKVVQIESTTHSEKMGVIVK